jgi:hypothetical protein
MKHNLSKTKIYQTLAKMKDRCYNPKSEVYKDYGDRGIAICDEWLDKENGYINFYNWSMKNGYQDDLTIDRINNNGNYEPSNCRWTTNQEQQYNKRDTYYIKYKNKRYCLSQFAKKHGIDKGTLKYRWEIGLRDDNLLNHKIPSNQTNITYNGKTHSIIEWSKITELDRKTITYRYKNGFPIDKLFCKPYEHIQNPNNSNQYIKAKQISGDR